MIYEADELMEDVMYVSDALRRELMTAYIEPYYKKAIVELLDAKSFYKKIGMIFETTAKLCVAVSSILSFSTGYSHKNTEYFAATSGSIGCLSLGLMQVASYAYKEQIRQSKELNGILKKLRLQTIHVERHNSTDTRRPSPEMKKIDFSNIRRSSACAIENDDSVITSKFRGKARRGTIYKIQESELEEIQQTPTVDKEDQTILIRNTANDHILMQAQYLCSTSSNTDPNLLNRDTECTLYV